MKRLKQIVVVALTMGVVAMLVYGCKKSDGGDSDSKNILEFKIGETKGNILNGAKTVKISLLYGTDVTALEPEIKLPKYATIEPASGVAVDFTEPVIYTVTAQDLTTKEYTVTVTLKDASKQAGIEYFGVRVGDEDIAGFIMDQLITLEIPEGTDITALVPTINISKYATISPASGVAQDFSQAALEYVVTAQDIEIESTYTFEIIYIAE